MIGEAEAKASRLTRVYCSELTLVTVPVMSTLPCSGRTLVISSRCTTSGSVGAFLATAPEAGARRGRMVVIAATVAASTALRAARYDAGLGTGRL